MYCSNSLRFTNFLLPTKSTNGQFGERSILSILLIPILLYSAASLVPLTLQRTNFCELGGIPKNSFHFTTDIFSEKNRGLPEKSENKMLPALEKAEA